MSKEAFKEKADPHEQVSNLTNFKRDMLGKSKGRPRKGQEGGSVKETTDSQRVSSGQESSSRERAQGSSSRHAEEDG